MNQRMTFKRHRPVNLVSAAEPVREIILVIDEPEDRLDEKADLHAYERSFD